MRKLVTLGLALGVAVVTASPVFAQEPSPAQIEDDMYVVVANRAALDRELDVVARGGPTDQDASTGVLGVQARPELGIALSPSVAEDMLSVVQQRFDRARDLATAP